MSAAPNDLSSKAYKTAQAINYGCVNRKVLLDKDINSMPPSLRILLSNPTTEETHKTEMLVQHILNKKQVLDQKIDDEDDQKIEYSFLARSADELCGISSKLVEPSSY